MAPRLRRQAVVGGLAVAALWIAAAWWVVAVHPWAGPVLVTVTETNGVHVGDIPAVVLGAVTTVWFWRGPRSPRTRCRLSASGG